MIFKDLVSGDAPAGEDPPDDYLRILFVCTANVCRSPLAAALMKISSRRQSLPIHVASAGFLEGGVRAHDDIVSLVASLGVQLGDRKSRQLTPELVNGADAVLTMTCEHAVKLVGEFPEAMPRVYTAKHFVKAAGRRKAGESLRSWISELNAGTARNYVTGGSEFDIDDPMGQPRAAFEELLSELLVVTDHIVGCAAGDRAPWQIPTG